MLETVKYRRLTKTCPPSCNYAYCMFWTVKLALFVRIVTKMTVTIFYFLGAPVLYCFQLNFFIFSHLPYGFTNLPYFTWLTSCSSILVIVLNSSINILTWKFNLRKTPQIGKFKCKFSSPLHTLTTCKWTIAVWFRCVFLVYLLGVCVFLNLQVTGFLPKVQKYLFGIIETYISYF